MRFRNPIYIPFALAIALALALANHNGWSLVQSLATRAWQHSTPNTQHK
jgi:hypothetical protein